jgi:hypothetical protein
MAPLDKSRVDLLLEPISYRDILDQAREFLAPIMSNSEITNMPYKDLLYEMEQRRLYMEEQLKANRTSNQNKK